MSWSVEFRPQAEAEVLDVRGWYDERRDGLGKEFSIAVHEVVTRIADNPYLFPRIQRETRRAVLRRFPYAIYFRILEETVVVLAVHGRQDPQRWRSRS